MRWMLTIASAFALSGTVSAVASASPFVDSARFENGFGVVRIGTSSSSTREFVSRDEGRSFRRLPAPGGSTGDLVLLASGLGYRTADGERLWRTTDGAHHWQRTSLGPGITDVEAVSTSVWALRSRGFGKPVRLVRSEDGGRTWVSQPTPIGYGPDGPDGRFAFADAADGVLTGLTAKSRLILRVTRDGGRTWTARKPPCSTWWTPEKGAPIVRWLPSGTMWFLCYGMHAGGSSPLELYESFDGGRTFTLRSRTARGKVFGPLRGEVGRGLGGKGGYPVDLDPQDSDTATLTTGNSVTHTTDGGRTWTTTPHLPVAFEQLFDFDADGPTQWLSRGASGLLRSDDGGASWHRVALP